MTKLIVLDEMIGSMTEFKQIIGRGTRIREKEGKMHFTVMDFRNVTRLFANPEWDGPIEQHPDFGGEDGVTLINPMNEQNGTDEDGSNGQYDTPDDHGDKAVFHKGDILYSKLRPYLQKNLIAPEDGICSSEMVPFRLYGNINPSYILKVLMCPYVNDAINSVTYGVKMPRVGTETMLNLLIPLPPLNEQQRIVCKLDKLFAIACRLPSTRP